MVVALVVEWFEQEADLNLQVTRKVAEERIDRPEQKCSAVFGWFSWTWRPSRPRPRLVPSLNCERFYS